MAHYGIGAAVHFGVATIVRYSSRKQKNFAYAWENITIEAWLLLPSPRAAFLSRASDPRLRDVIAQLFRRNARVGSGSAMDAFRFEQQTGILLSPSGHALKLFERRIQLQRLLRDARLLLEDRQIVKELLIDIQNALSGQ